MAKRRNLKQVKSAYSKKRVDLKKAFYSLKKQGFTTGNYKDTREYKNLVKAERSAIYRYKNRDKIAERRKERLSFAGKGTEKTITAVNAEPAYKAFAGGRNSGYFKILSLLLKDRVFFGYIEIILPEDEGFEDIAIKSIKVSNPYLSVAGYYKKIRQIVDIIQRDTSETEYLFLTTIVSIKYTYNDEKIVVTHIFDFSNA